MKKKFLDELSNDFGKLLSSGENYDVIIEAGENENVKKFRTHLSILSSRSTYFKSALSKNWAYKEHEKIIFKKPNISPETMELLLKYIYTGMINMDKQKGSEVLKLLIASDEMDFRKLSDYIENYIMGKKANFLLLNEDPIEVLQTVFQYESLTVLRDFCLELICSNSEILFESPKFLTIDKSLLILFIQRDDLNIGECEIWEYVLKWGTSQLLGVNELPNWTKEYLIELEEILHDIIPLIRWFHIPSKLFHEKIRPYKMIFPEKLYDDIVGYYIDPNLPPKSTILLEPRKSAFKIINRKHFAIVSSWIDGKPSNHYNIRNTPHSFELLYKASRDGFDSTKFDELCEEGSTLMIAKIKNTGRLIGGYTLEGWKSKNDFLFSFENQDDINSPIIAKYRRNTSTKLKDPRFIQDPSFGNNNMSDLTINNKDHTIECNSTHSFPEIKSFINVGQKFLLEDYEVYKVTKASKLVNYKRIAKTRINSMAKLTRDSIIVIFIPIIKFILQGCANILVNVSQKDKINSIVKFVSDLIIVILQRWTNTSVITLRSVIEFFTIFFMLLIPLLFINIFYKLNLIDFKFIMIFTLVIYIYLKI